ncbi:hypothetical protein [Oceanobacter kriegii]|nr:hypothetical protein [Oceanobacter kriegii]
MAQAYPTYTGLGLPVGGSLLTMVIIARYLPEMIYHKMSLAFV